MIPGENLDLHKAMKSPRNRIIKNYKWCEILPYLQASKLAFHSVMSAGWGYETPASKTKKFITNNIATCMSFTFVLGDHAAQAPHVEEIT